MLYADDLIFGPLFGKLYDNDICSISRYVWLDLFADDTVIKSVISKCYSSEKLIALNTLHEIVTTWYSSYSWVDMKQCR